MTVIGYIVFALYTCGIVGLGVLLERKTHLDSVLCRKLTPLRYPKCSIERCCLTLGRTCDARPYR